MNLVSVGLVVVVVVGLVVVVVLRIRRWVQAVSGVGYAVGWGGGSRRTWCATCGLERGHEPDCWQRHTDPHD